ncbi:MAG: hypothetical protein HKL99_15285 [Burkholderiales bacterium]|jgi:hypothetical protein|nr:hypothetical protein [Burkholderiales bacterium]
MAHWTDEYMVLVRDCELRESRLTEWERGFVESIRTRLDAGAGLTMKQTETLDGIWERITARG